MIINLSVNTRAVLWVTASTALFSIVFASGKFAGDIASPIQILFLRYVSGFLTLLIFNQYKKQPLGVYASKTPFAHLSRAFFGAFGGVSVIYATSHMPIMDATAIGLLDGVILVILGIAILREKISFTHWLAIIVSIFGAIIIVFSKDAFQQTSMAYLVPALVALAGAVLIALECLMIKKLSVREKPMAVLLYVNFFCAILLFIPALVDWRSTLISDNIPFICLGPLAVFAQYLTIRGYQLTNLSILGPVNYSWMIFAALIGYFFFKEFPTPGTIIGCLLITAGGVMLALQQDRNQT